jgi:Ca2+-binding EF-hand superfamily protein
MPTDDGGEQEAEAAAELPALIRRPAAAAELPALGRPADKRHKSKVEVEDTEAFDELFRFVKAFDSDSDGCISAAEMREYLVAVGAWGTEPIYAEPAWSDAWPSVCTMLGAAGSSSAQDKIFRACDVDGNGRIDAAEIVALASRLGQRWTAQQTAAAMSEMDADGGGTVDVGLYPIVTLEKQLPNMIGNLV